MTVAYASSHFSTPKTQSETAQQLQLNPLALASLLKGKKAKAPSSPSNARTTQTDPVLKLEFLDENLQFLAQVVINIDIDEEGLDWQSFGTTQQTVPLGAKYAKLTLKNGGETTFFDDLVFSTLKVEQENDAGG